MPPKGARGSRCPEGNRRGYVDGSHPPVPGGRLVRSRCSTAMVSCGASSHAIPMRFFLGVLGASGDRLRCGLRFGTVVVSKVSLDIPGNRLIPTC